MTRCFAVSRRAISTVMFLMGLLPLVQAQTPSPSFEVASIKPADPAERLSMIQFAPGGRFRAVNVTLKNLVCAAWHVQDFEITGAPGWMTSEKFDIDARSTGVTDDDPRAMTNEQITARAALFEAKIRALLESRFSLKVHREMRELPIYALVIAKNGPKLPAATIQTEGAPKRPGFEIGRGELSGTNATMQIMSQGLSEETGRAVLDQTGLKGTYDYKLEWTPEPGELPTIPVDPVHPPRADPAGPSLFTAIQEQLGLKLQPTKGLVEVLVIEYVERPSAN